MRLLERLLAGNWFIVEEAPPKNLQVMLKKAFAVDSQPVADWLQEAYGTTPEEPEFFGSPGGLDTSLLSGQLLFRLPFSPLWMEWKRLDGAELGVLLFEWPAIDSHCVWAAFFLRPNRASRAEYLGAGDFRTDAEFHMNSVGHPVACGWVALETVEAAVTFFHCKNVKIVAAPKPRKLAKKLSKRFGIQIPTFHVIEVHLTSKRYVGAERSSGKEGGFVSRIIRGHFKRYEGESKLFGELSGVWWWQMHVAGQGEVEKMEYRTWPPKGRHRKECLLRLKEGA